MRQLTKVRVVVRPENKKTLIVRTLISTSGSTEDKPLPSAAVYYLKRLHGETVAHSAAGLECLCRHFSEIFTGRLIAWFDSVGGVVTDENMDILVNKAFRTTMISPQFAKEFHGVVLTEDRFLTEAERLWSI